MFVSSRLHQVTLIDSPQCLTGHLTVRRCCGTVFNVVPCRTISSTSHEGIKSKIEASFQKLIQQKSVSQYYGKFWQIHLQYDYSINARNVVTFSKYNIFIKKNSNWYDFKKENNINNLIAISIHRFPIFSCLIVSLSFKSLWKVFTPLFYNLPSPLPALTYRYQIGLRTDTPYINNNIITL